VIWTSAAVEDVSLIFVNGSVVQLERYETSEGFDAYLA
jgi:hypothetical protein